MNTTATDAAIEELEQICEIEEAGFRLVVTRPLTPGYLKNLPPQYQSQPYTSQTAKDIALGASRVGIHVSPLIVDNSIFGLSGGAGRTLTGLADVPLRALHGIEKAPASRLADNAVLGAFVARWPDTNAESIRKFYDRRDELERKEAAATFERKYPGRAPGATRLTGQERAELYRLRAGDEQMRTLNQRARQITSASGLAPEDKRRRLDEIQTRMLNTARRALGKPLLAQPAAH
ncbi:MAG TPA: LPD38 domain-containing protein [Terriglobales bacterium]|nr:LPD38 domain-containing protein [Terriglobales bacterium]